MFRMIFISLLLLSGPASARTMSETVADVAITTRNAANPAGNPYTRCGTAKRINCVVDGDTFWHHGDKIRISDINTPEISHPDCANEASLGVQATLRLTQLLNAGPFALEQQGRDKDRYGRKLRVVTRRGASVGEILVQEGLAERWTGRRRNWCTGV